MGFQLSWTCSPTSFWSSKIISVFGFRDARKRGGGELVPTVLLLKGEVESRLRFLPARSGGASGHALLCSLSREDPSAPGQGGAETLVLTELG